MIHLTILESQPGIDINASKLSLTWSVLKTEWHKSLWVRIPPLRMVIDNRKVWAYLGGSHQADRLLFSQLSHEQKCTSWRLETLHWWKQEKRDKAGFKPTISRSQCVCFTAVQLPLSRQSESLKLSKTRIKLSGIARVSLLQSPF